MMQNILLETIEYKVDRTRFGVWRRYLYPTGAYFAEFKSHAAFLGMPLLHYTRGRCPETGKRVVAKGVVAVGRLAAGLFAVGHAAFGVVAVGQLALGLVFGLGQASTGLAAIGQIAAGIMFGCGQMVTGVVAIGQIGYGKYVLAQTGLGDYVWTREHVDPEAVAFFKSLWARFELWLRHLRASP